MSTLCSRALLGSILVLLPCAAGCSSGEHVPVAVDVRDARTGLPVEGLTVILTTPEPFHPLRFPGDYLKSNRPDRRQVVTNQSGTALFDAVGPGPVNFTFLLEGIGVDSFPFDDPPADTRPFPWQLIPRGLAPDTAAAERRLYEVRFRRPDQKEGPAFQTRPNAAGTDGTVAPVSP